MKDTFHRLTNWLSYNRFLAVALLLSAALLVPACAGWSFEGTSPVDGKPATETKLVAQETAEKARLKAELDKATKARDSRIAGLRAMVEAESIKINDEYDAVLIDTEQEVARLDAGFAAARTEIEQKREALQGWFDTASALLTMAGPGVSEIATPILAIIGAGLFGDNWRKNRRIDTLKVAAAGKPAVNVA